MVRRARVRARHLTDVAFGITFLGNVPIRIPVWPSVELQSAMSFSNLAVPVAADTAIQVRFLQKQGLDLPSAVATGGVLSSVSEIIVQIALFFVAVWLAPDSIDFGRIDTGQLAVIALIVVFVRGRRAGRRLRRSPHPAPGAAAGHPRDPHGVGGGEDTEPHRAARRRQHRRAVPVRRVAARMPPRVRGERQLLDAARLNIGISTIASLVPIPGGGTAVSSVGLAGMLTAFGVTPAAAGAAVLAHQLAVTYLPAIPGWFATHDLIRKGML